MLSPQQNSESAAGQAMMGTSGAGTAMEFAWPPSTRLIGFKDRQVGAQQERIIAGLVHPFAH